MEPDRSRMTSTWSRRVRARATYASCFAAWYFGERAGEEALREAHQQHPRGAVEGAEVRGRLRADHEVAQDIGLYKVEHPEIEPWDFEQYVRILKAAKVEGPEWYAAVCLAGEAGLRSGEVKALRWREDTDLIAKAITVNQQTGYGETTTPKGRTRRMIPMTAALEKALRALETIRLPKTDGQANAVMLRICRRPSYRRSGGTRCATRSGRTPRSSA